MFTNKLNNRGFRVWSALLAMVMSLSMTANAQEDEAGDETETPAEKESGETSDGASESPLDAALSGGDDEPVESAESHATDEANTEDVFGQEDDGSINDAEPVEAETTAKEDDPEESANDKEEVVDFEEVEVEYDGSEEGRGIFPSEFDGDIALRRDRGINILTARAVRPMSLLLVVDHRAYKNLFSGKDAFFDYLGLDYGSLKLGLGLRFGIIDGLDAGIYRLNDGGTVPFDTYELDVRYAFLRQEKFHVDVSARAGISWFATPDAGDAIGGYGQIFIDRVLFDMLLLGVGFQYHSDSTGPFKSDGDDNHSAAVQAVIEWRMLQILALNIEAAYTVLGYKDAYPPDSGTSYPSLTFALKFITFRHTFSIMLSNTQFINADGIVANTARAFDELIFGFQICREFNFGKSE